MLWFLRCEQMLYIVQMVLIGNYLAFQFVENWCRPMKWWTRSIFWGAMESGSDPHDGATNFYRSAFQRRFFVIIKISNPDSGQAWEVCVHGCRLTSMKCLHCHVFFNFMSAWGSKAFMPIIERSADYFWCTFYYCRVLLSQHMIAQPVQISDVLEPVRILE